MDYWGHIIGVITVILLIAFVGIWIWAWLPRHKAVFNRMARVPLDRDDRPDVDPEQDQDEQDHDEQDDDKSRREEDEGSKR